MQQQRWECGLRMETQILVHEWGGGGQSMGAVIATCLNLNMHNNFHHMMYQLQL